MQEGHLGDIGPHTQLPCPMPVCVHSRAHAHTHTHIDTQARDTLVSPQPGFLRGGHCLWLRLTPPLNKYCLLCLPLPGWAMDPHEMVVKNPYAQVSIPRAHLRPDLGQQLEAAPSSWESQPLPAGSCPSEPTRLLQPTEEAPGSKDAKGAKGATQTQGQQAWLQPGNPYGSGQHPAGLTYAGRPPMGRRDDIAHHCCCCPCCSCCHCPRFCRCHSCCCIIS
ncbi:cysteine-rich tail protein 1 isoform X1 [Vulpes lagopus]|uniref:cysteine-rich tail protein 1 isoform X1 n=2 Tax=Vulpes lagopus TaxID=494514 RepID=UPI001BCA40BE|nr:cysteine-rich tail protein 1 isoform X1 [Vulpes lagopus]